MLGWGKCPSKCPEASKDQVPPGVMGRRSGKKSTGDENPVLNVSVFRAGALDFCFRQYRVKDALRRRAMQVGH